MREEKILEVKNLSGPGFVNVSFDLHKGEIVGFAGLTGAGRTETCTTIFGVQKPYAGTMTIHGKPFAPKNVMEAMNAGVGYLPEDRKQVAIFDQMSIRENVIASTIDDFSKGGLIDAARVNKEAGDMLSAMEKYMSDYCI